MRLVYRECTRLVYGLIPRGLEYLFENNNGRENVAWGFLEEYTLHSSKLT